MRQVSEIKDGASSFRAWKTSNLIFLSTVRTLNISRHHQFLNEFLKLK